MAESRIDIATVQASTINRFSEEEKELEKGKRHKLCVFKIHLVLVAIVHKILLLPIEISSSLADGVIQL